MAFSSHDSTMATIDPSIICSSVYETGGCKKRLRPKLRIDTSFPSTGTKGYNAMRRPLTPRNKFVTAHAPHKLQGEQKQPAHNEDKRNVPAGTEPSLFVTPFTDEARYIPGVGTVYQSPKYWGHPSLNLPTSEQYVPRPGARLPLGKFKRASWIPSPDALTAGSLDCVREALHAEQELLQAAFPSVNAGTPMQEDEEEEVEEVEREALVCDGNSPCQQLYHPGACTFETANCWQSFYRVDEDMAEYLGDESGIAAASDLEGLSLEDLQMLQEVRTLEEMEDSDIDEEDMAELEGAADVDDDVLMASDMAHFDEEALMDLTTTGLDEGVFTEEEYATMNAEFIDSLGEEQLVWVYSLVNGLI